MKSSVMSIALAALMGIGPTHAAQITYTSPVGSTGNNFTLLAPGNTLVGGTNDVIFYWDGTLNTSVAGAVANASLSSDQAFFGALWSAHDVTLYAPGTYTIYDGCPPGNAGCGIGNAVTFNVGPSQIGAHMLFDWPVGGSGPVNANMDVINVWNMNLPWAAENPASPFYTGPDNGTNCAPPTGGTCIVDGLPNTPSTVFGLISTDVNGDGTPGSPMTDGPFVSLSANFNLQIGPPQPGIAVSIDVSGGTTQECAETGGSAVAISANVTLTGGAELASVAWTIDGASAGSGDTITPFLDLGPHTIQALATTTTGESDTASVTVTVADTTPPTVDAHFLDSRTGEPVDRISGNRAQFVTVSFGASDVCDPQVQTQGAVTPTFGVNDGDTIKIQGNNQTVKLPTTALELSVTATDDSGNRATGQAILSISN
jgi:hypothetical protein